MSRITEGQSPFDLYSHLPATFSQEVKELVQFCSAHVKNGSLDWTGFKKALDNYDGDELIFDKYNNRSIAQQEETIKAIEEKFLDYLIEVFKPRVDRADLEQFILQTLTQLEWAQGHGWVTYFPPEPTTHPTQQAQQSLLTKLTSKLSKPGEEAEPRSSWEIRMIIFTPSARIPSDFRALLTTFKLSANIPDQAGWYGLKPDTVKKFSYDATAYDLVVSQGFKST